MCPLKNRKNWWRRGRHRRRREHHARKTVRARIDREVPRHRRRARAVRTRTQIVFVDALLGGRIPW